MKLYNDDYINVLQLIPDESVDLVVTDPPYKFNNAGGAFMQIIKAQKGSI